MQFLNSRLNMLKKKSGLIVTMMILSGGTVLGSCSSKKFSEKSGPVAKEFRMYDFDPEKGKVFHNKCKKTKGDDRKCTRTELDIMENWEMFFYGKFIIIPEGYFL